MPDIGSLIGLPVRPFLGPASAGAGDQVELRTQVAALPRNETIDVIRLFAAASVVFVHASKSAGLVSFCHSLRFAVPFFLFASLYYQSLSLRRNPDRSLGGYIWARVKRLYFPFLAWSLIYLVARNFKRITMLNADTIKLRPALLWTGTEYHLYFLPLLLVFSVLLVVIHWVLLRRDRRWRWPLIVLAVGAGFLFALAPIPSSWDERFVLVLDGRILSDNPTYAFMWGWRALPAAFWAMAFAWLMTAGPVVYSIPISMGLAGIALTIFCSVQQAMHGIMLIPRALTGLGSFMAALAPWNWSGPTFAILARWGRYGYGIYLCHVLVVEAVRALAARLLHLETSVPLDLGIFILGFLGSVMLVSIIGKSPRLAWLNG